MEMESSGRPPFDRTRELRMKKPRLTDEPTLAARQFQRSVTQFRRDEGEREADDPSRGVLQQYMQHQELVNHYKTALAELTFNSKPIITNLTIIAGENLQAAKAIAATICSNILEVPREQKLPSLYLLDSIVKNIGRDYIKYFATRLPEVFCKAYRQVNPSVHQGMRHLFGTWRGVFPHQTLQIIERELGFQDAVNGPSSGSSTSKADQHSQRQPHSIHVNPKYLEARQRLQQSNRPQGTNTVRADVQWSKDAESPGRTASAVTERPWTNPSMKTQTIRPQREALRESSHQKRGGGGYGDLEVASGLARPSRTLLGEPSEWLIGQGHDKRCLGADREVDESRNEYDVKRGIPNYTASMSGGTNIASIKKRSSVEMSRNWKNSEEEEYVWDDLGVGVTDPNDLSGANKDISSSDDLLKLEFGSHLPKWQSQAEVRSKFERDTSVDTLYSEQKDQVAVRPSRLSPWKIHEPYQVDNSRPLLQQAGTCSVTGSGLSPEDESSFGFQTAVPGTVGSMGQHHPSPRRPLMHQRSPSPSFSKRDPRQHFAEKGHTKSHSSARSDRRIASVSGQKTMGLHDNNSQISVPAQNHNPQSGLAGQSDVSSLLAAVVKSGLLSGSSVSEQPSIEAPAMVPITSQAMFPGSKDTMTLSGPPCNSIAPYFPQMKAEKPPLASGSPSSSSTMNSAPLQTSDVASGNSNSLSSLFSSLLAKGVISPSKTEPTPSAPMQPEDQVKKPIPTVATKAAVTVESASKSYQVKKPSPTMATKAPVTAGSASESSAVSEATTTDKLSFSELAGKKSDASAQSTKEEIENLIGFEFRQPVLRELHPEVIDRLTDDVPHRCTACGLQVKLKSQLDRHTEWHAFRNSILSSLSKPSRRWYSNSADWVAGKAGFPFGYKSNTSMHDSSDTAGKNEKVVPADESQCLCLLCGELFEDFYSQEGDEWMFNGAVYMSIPSGGNEGGPSGENGSHNVIVHAKCSSDDSVNRLGLGL